MANNIKINIYVKYMSHGYRNKDKLFIYNTCHMATEKYTVFYKIHVILLAK